jgi:hypothetical protein
MSGLAHAGHGELAANAIDGFAGSRERVVQSRFKPDQRLGLSFDDLTSPVDEGVSIAMIESKKLGSHNFA